MKLPRLFAALAILFGFFIVGLEMWRQTTVHILTAILGGAAIGLGFWILDSPDTDKFTARLGYLLGRFFGRGGGA